MVTKEDGREILAETEFLFRLRRGDKYHKFYNGNLGDLQERITQNSSAPLSRGEGRPVFVWF